MANLRLCMFTDGKSSVCNFNIDDADPHFIIPRPDIV